MSRALGDSAATRIGVLCTPGVQTIKLTPEDRYVVLATDGVWDGIELDEAVKCLSVCSSANECSQTLNKAGLDGLKRKHIDDNLTNIVIALNIK